MCQATATKTGGFCCRQDCGGCTFWLCSLVSNIRGHTDYSVTTKPLCNNLSLRVANGAASPTNAFKRRCVCVQKCRQPGKTQLNVNSTFQWFHSHSSSSEIMITPPQDFSRLTHRISDSIRYACDFLFLTVRVCDRCMPLKCYKALHPLHRSNVTFTDSSAPGAPFQLSADVSRSPPARSMLLKS